MMLNVIGNGSSAVPTAESAFRVGEWVEVRSKEEILKTLDQQGRLDGMPFMPEMLEWCGKRLRVYKSAHKTCDTVNDYKGRRLHDAVHLEDARCNGKAHGGCQAGCLLFWKTAWIRPVSEPVDASGRHDSLKSAAMEASIGCTEADVSRSARRDDENGEPVYVCQATELPAATQPLDQWEVHQYIQDYRSGNVTLARMASSFVFMFYRHWLIDLGIGLGPVLRWLYDAFQRLRGGVPYPRRHGRLPVGSRTPTAALNLQPGEWVRVKPLSSILETCDEELFNRGMKFDAELVPYCGGSYRVLRRVTHIVNEKTGTMQVMKNPCIILDSVACEARYSECRLFCPRSVYAYWREIWLERVDGPAGSAPGLSNG